MLRDRRQKMMIMFGRRPAPVPDLERALVTPVAVFDAPAQYKGVSTYA